jgi:hypothetical protein
VNIHCGKTAKSIYALSLTHSPVPSPKFKFINRTEIEGDGTGECVKLKAYMDLAVLPQ